MATTKKTNPDTDETAKAIAFAKSAIKGVASASAVPGAVTRENVREFNNLIEDLIGDLRKVKAGHTKMLRVAQSSESRKAKAERVKKALALLEAQEKEEAPE